MDLIFPSAGSVDMTFKVDIAGTQTPPQQVSVVLERGGRSISFNATKEGDDWNAVIDNPGSFFYLGDVNVSVNVILNNRIFVPMKAVGKIIEEPGGREHGSENCPVINPEVPTVPEAPSPMAQAEIPDVAVEIPEAKTEPKVEPKVEPKKPAKAQSAIKSLLQSVEPAIEAPPAVKKIVDKIIPKEVIPKAKPVPAPKAKPVIKEPPPITGLLKSVEPAKEAKPKAKPVKEQAPTEPVVIFTLKKTKVIYK
jgi:hypothetical protein